MHNLLRIFHAVWWWLVLVSPPFLLLLWIFDRRPRRSVACVYRWTGWILVGLALTAFVLPFLRPQDAALPLQRGFLAAIVLGVLATAFLAAYGVALKTLVTVVEGDAVAHWGQLLTDGEPWWWRSRAARELGTLTDHMPTARATLRAALPRESNRHVRAAIGRALQ